MKFLEAFFDITLTNNIDNSEYDFWSVTDDGKYLLLKNKEQESV